MDDYNGFFEIGREQNDLVGIGSEGDGEAAATAEVTRTGPTTAVVTILLLIVISLAFVIFYVIVFGQSRSAYRMSQFNEIRTGMSVDQVQSIMGSPGELSVDAAVAGYSGQIYTWQNPDGGNLMVQFQDGAVISKAQAGLR